MAGRTQRDRDKERFWRQMLRQWRRSGLGVRAFCQQHQLSEPLFYAWRRTLQERDRQAPATPQPDAPAFVPVTLVAPTPPLELVLAGGRAVRIPAGFDAATLRQLLAVLDEEPSC